MGKEGKMPGKLERWTGGTSKNAVVSNYFTGAPMSK